MLMGALQAMPAEPASKECGVVSRACLYSNMINNFFAELCSCIQLIVNAMKQYFSSVSRFFV